MLVEQGELADSSRLTASTNTNIKSTPENKQNQQVDGGPSVSVCLESTALYYQF